MGDLATIGQRKAVSDYQTVIDFIEKNMIQGKISVSRDQPLPVFSYRPEHSQVEFPMFLTSDVVREISPLILMLQYYDLDTLFMEEPEMNLHPKLQQMMARVLIRLSNAGLSVLAATHSDSILQHVNNMIKLYNLPEKRQAEIMKRYDFAPEDLISAEDVVMYQFDVQESGRTMVRKLSCGDYGFEIPTFYDALETLLKQTGETEPDF